MPPCARSRVEAFSISLMLASLPFSNAVHAAGACERLPERSPAMFPPEPLSMTPIADALSNPDALVPCPLAFRAEAQRALLLRLQRAAFEMRCCARSAVEIGMPVTARRIENVRSLCAELPNVLREDPR